MYLQLHKNLKKLNSNPRNNFLFLANEYGAFMDLLALENNSSAERLRTQFGETSETFREKFGNNKALLIFILALNPKASAESAAEKIGASSRTVEKYLADLKGKVIKRIGLDYGGRWGILVDK